MNFILLNVLNSNLANYLKVERFTYKPSVETTYKAGYNYDVMVDIQVPSGYKILGIVGTETHNSGLTIKCAYPMFYQGVKHVMYTKSQCTAEIDVKISANQAVLSAHVLFIKE